MSIRIPQKADIETQNAFRDVEARLRALEAKPTQSGASAEDVQRLKAEMDSAKPDPDRYEELRESTFIAPVNFLGSPQFPNGAEWGFIRDGSDVLDTDAQKVMNLNASLAISPGGLSADSVFARKADIQGGDIYCPNGVRSQRAYIKRAASQSIANTTYDDVEFDTETANPDSLWSSGDTTKITLNRDGLWLIVSNTIWDADTDGYRLHELHLNDTTVIARSSNYPGFGAGSVVFLGELSDGDYVESRVWHSAGNALNLTANIGVYFLCET